MDIPSLLTELANMFMVARKLDTSRAVSIYVDWLIRNFGSMNAVLWFKKKDGYYAIEHYVKHNVVDTEEVILALEDAGLRRALSERMVAIPSSRFAHVADLVGHEALVMRLTLYGRPFGVFMIFRRATSRGAFTGWVKNLLLRSESIFSTVLYDARNDATQPDTSPRPPDSPRKPPDPADWWKRGEEPFG